MGKWAGALLAHRVHPRGVLLSESLYPAPAEEPDGEEPAPVFALYTDQELTAMGYEWPASLYPVCAEP